MDITVLDKSFNRIAILDTVESIVWTDRYNQYGDFEIYTQVTDYMLSILKEDFYLQIPNSDRTMIIETIVIKTDVENGNKLVVRGRSLESILTRRVVWPRFIADTNFHNALKSLIYANLMTGIPGFPGPTETARIIPNFVFTDNPSSYLNSTNIKFQSLGDYVYDVVSGVCLQNSVGFKIVLNALNQFEFTFYLGSNRSYTQNTNPFVVFSNKFDNLIESTYIQSTVTWKTLRRILGDSSDGVQILTGSQIFGGDLLPPVEKREHFYDLSHLSKFLDDGVTPINPATYIEQLRAEAGRIWLRDHKKTKLFDARVDTTSSYKYGIDFFLGDIVQVEDQYKNSGRARITEVTFSENSTGVGTYPIFEFI
jgi:hypothetical protein